MSDDFLKVSDILQRESVRHSVGHPKIDLSAYFRCNFTQEKPKNRAES